MRGQSGCTHLQPVFLYESKLNYSFLSIHTTAKEGSRGAALSQAKHRLLSEIKDTCFQCALHFLSVTFISHGGIQLIFLPRLWAHYSPPPPLTTNSHLTPPAHLLARFCTSHPLTIMLGASTDVRSNSYAARRRDKRKKIEDERKGNRRVTLLTSITCQFRAPLLPEPHHINFQCDILLYCFQAGPAFVPADLLPRHILGKLKYRRCARCSFACTLIYYFLRFWNVDFFSFGMTLGGMIMDGITSRRSAALLYLMWLLPCTLLTYVSARTHTRTVMCKYTQDANVCLCGLRGK